VLDELLAQEPQQPPRNRAAARGGQLAVKLDPVFPLWDELQKDVFTPLLSQLWQNRATAREVTGEIVAQSNRLLAERGGSRR
jgi:hypothetical protein